MKHLNEKSDALLVFNKLNEANNTDFSYNEEISWKEVFRRKENNIGKIMKRTAYEFAYKWKIKEPVIVFNTYDNIDIKAEYDIDNNKIIIYNPINETVNLDDDIGYAIDIIEKWFQDNGKYIISNAEYRLNLAKQIADEVVQSQKPDWMRPYNILEEAVFISSVNTDTLTPTIVKVKEGYTNTKDILFLTEEGVNKFLQIYKDSLLSNVYNSEYPISVEEFKAVNLEEFKNLSNSIFEYRSKLLLEDRKEKDKKSEEANRNYLDTEREYFNSLKN